MTEKTIFDKLSGRALKSGLLNDYARLGHARKVQELLEDSDLDLNIEDCLGNTPLMCACRSGSKDIAQMLVTAGAEVNFVNALGESALNIAVQQEDDDMALFLLEAGADYRQCSQIPLSDAVHRKIDELEKEKNLQKAVAFTRRRRTQERKP